MKKILMLLIVAAVIAIPAMANPENEPIAVAKNVKSILVETDGANVANNNVAQTLTNLGNQNNWAQGIAAAGNAMANSANVGYANSGATSAAANSNDAMGDSKAKSEDNYANNYQKSKADADGGDAYGFYDKVIQKNEVDQDADAKIKNDQDMNETVTIDEFQDAVAKIKGDQTIADSMFVEHNWTKDVTNNIN